jgi:hypothetical protein
MEFGVQFVITKSYSTMISVLLHNTGNKNNHIYSTAP